MAHNNTKIDIQKALQGLAKLDFKKGVDKFWDLGKPKKAKLATPKQVTDITRKMAAPDKAAPLVGKQGFPGSYMTKKGFEGYTGFIKPIQGQDKGSKTNILVPSFFGYAEFKKSKGPWKRGKETGYAVIHTGELDTHPYSKNIPENSTHWQDIKANIGAVKNYHVVDSNGEHVHSSPTREGANSVKNLAEKSGAPSNQIKNASKMGMFRTKEEKKHDIIGRGSEYKGTSRKVKHPDGSVTTIKEHESYEPSEKSY